MELVALSFVGLAKTVTNAGKAFVVLSKNFALKSLVRSIVIQNNPQNANLDTYVFCLEFAKRVKTKRLDEYFNSDTNNVIL